MKFESIFGLICYSLVAAIWIFVLFNHIKQKMKFKKKIKELDKLKDKYKELIANKLFFNYLFESPYKNNDKEFRAILFNNLWEHYGLHDTHFYSIWISIVDFQNMDEVGEKMKFLEYTFGFGSPKWIFHDLKIGQRDNCDGKFLIFEYMHNKNVPLDEKELEDFK